MSSCLRAMVGLLKDFDSIPSSHLRDDSGLNVHFQRTHGPLSWPLWAVKACDSQNYNQTKQLSTKIKLIF